MARMVAIIQRTVKPLEHMVRFVEGGPEFYGLAETAQDHYLNIMIDQALTTGEPVKTSLQPWTQI